MSGISGGWWVERVGRKRRGKGGGTDLRFEEDGAETVEELEGRDDVALHQDAGRDCCGRPEARADGHLVEPLL